MSVKNVAVDHSKPPIAQQHQTHSNNGNGFGPFSTQQQSHHSYSHAPLPPSATAQYGHVVVGGAADGEVLRQWSNVMTLVVSSFLTVFTAFVLYSCYTLMAPYLTGILWGVLCSVIFHPSTEQWLESAERRKIRKDRCLVRLKAGYEAAEGQLAQLAWYRRYPTRVVYRLGTVYSFFRHYLFEVGLFLGIDKLPLVVDATRARRAAFYQRLIAYVSITGFLATLSSVIVVIYLQVGLVLTVCGLRLVFHAERFLRYATSVCDVSLAASVVLMLIVSFATDVRDVSDAVSGATEMLIDNTGVDAHIVEDFIENMQEKFLEDIAAGFNSSNVTKTAMDIRHTIEPLLTTNFSSVFEANFTQLYQDLMIALYPSLEEELRGSSSSSRGSGVEGRAPVGSLGVADTVGRVCLVQTPTGKQEYAMGKRDEVVSPVGSSFADGIKGFSNKAEGGMSVYSASYFGSFFSSHSSGGVSDQTLSDCSPEIQARFDASSSASASASAAMEPSDSLKESTAVVVATPDSTTHQHLVSLAEEGPNTATAPSEGPSGKKNKRNRRKHRASSSSSLPTHKEANTKPHHHHHHAAEQQPVGFMSAAKTLGTRWSPILSSIFQLLSLLISKIVNIFDAVYELMLFVFVYRFCTNVKMMPETILYSLLSKALALQPNSPIAHQRAYAIEEDIINQFLSLFQSFWHITWYHFAITFACFSLCGFPLPFFMGLLSVGLALFPLFTRYIGPCFIAFYVVVLLDLKNQELNVFREVILVLAMIGELKDEWLLSVARKRAGSKKRHHTSSHSNSSNHHHNHHHTASSLGGGGHHTNHAANSEKQSLPSAPPMTSRRHASAGGGGGGGVGSSASSLVKAPNTSRGAAVMTARQQSTGYSSSGGGCGFIVSSSVSPSSNASPSLNNTQQQQTISNSTSNQHNHAAAGGGSVATVDDPSSVLTAATNPLGVPRREQLPTFIVGTSVVLGLVSYGLQGVVIGPVIFIVTKALYDNFGYDPSSYMLLMEGGGNPGDGMAATAGPAPFPFFDHHHHSNMPVSTTENVTNGAKATATLASSSLATARRVAFGGHLTNSGAISSAASSSVAFPQQQQLPFASLPPTVLMGASPRLGDYTTPLPLSPPPPLPSARHRSGGGQPLTARGKLQSAITTAIYHQRQQAYLQQVQLAEQQHQQYYQHVQPSSTPPSGGGAGGATVVGEEGSASSPRGKTSTSRGGSSKGNSLNNTLSNASTDVASNNAQQRQQPATDADGNKLRNSSPPPLPSLNLLSPSMPSTRFSDELYTVVGGGQHDHDSQEDDKDVDDDIENDEAGYDEDDEGDTAASNYGYGATNSSSSNAMNGSGGGGSSSYNNFYRGSSISPSTSDDDRSSDDEEDPYCYSMSTNASPLMMTTKKQQSHFTADGEKQQRVGDDGAAMPRGSSSSSSSPSSPPPFVSISHHNDKVRKKGYNVTGNMASATATTTTSNSPTAGSGGGWAALASAVKGGVLGAVLGGHQPHDATVEKGAATSAALGNASEKKGGGSQQPQQKGGQTQPKKGGGKTKAMKGKKR